MVSQEANRLVPKRVANSLHHRRRRRRRRFLLSCVRSRVLLLLFVFFLKFVNFFPFFFPFFFVFFFTKIIIFSSKKEKTKEEQNFYIIKVFLVCVFRDDVNDVNERYIHIHTHTRIYKTREEEEEEGRWTRFVCSGTRSRAIGYCA